MLWWGVSVGNTSKIPFQPDFLWFLETEDKQIFNEVLHVPGQTCFILVHLYMFQILCCDVREQCDICTIPHFSLEQNRARNLLLTHLCLSLCYSPFSQMFLIPMWERKCFHCQYPSSEWTRRAWLTLAKYRLCIRYFRRGHSHYNPQWLDPGDRWLRALSKVDRWHAVF